MRLCIQLPFFQCSLLHLAASDALLNLPVIKIFMFKNLPKIIKTKFNIKLLNSISYH